MDAELRQFAQGSSSNSLHKLMALSELIKAIPQEKMAKVKRLTVKWDESSDGDLLPILDLEFSE